MSEQDKPEPSLLSKENQEQHNAMIRRINAMSEDEIKTLIAHDACPYDPQYLKGVPLGMFHCEVCGEMVVAGLPHPRTQIGNAHQGLPMSLTFMSDESDKNCLRVEDVNSGAFVGELQLVKVNGKEDGMVFYPRSGVLLLPEDLHQLARKCDEIKANGYRFETLSTERNNEPKQVRCTGCDKLVDENDVYYTSDGEICSTCAGKTA